MPAAYFWRPMTPETDGSFSSAVANNWRTGPAATAPVYTVAPGWEDDLYFQGDVSVVNCTIPDMPTPTNSAGLTFNSINLLFGQPLTPEPGPIGSPPPTPTPTPYTGIVTIKDSFAIGTLQVDCGYVKQADPAWLTPPVPYAPHAGTLTVTTALDWTGGTLNSNDTLGYIDLAPGSISVAAPSYTNPGINQTVELGSTITLLGTPVSPTPSLSSTLDVMSGDYNIRNFAGFVVGSQCNLRLLPQPGDAPPPGGGNPPQCKASIDLKVIGDPEGNGQDKTTGAVEIKENGTLTIAPHNRPAESTALATVTAAKGTIKNTGGKIILTDRVKATYGGKIDSNFTVGSGPNAPKYGASVTQSGADSSLSLQAGSELVTTYGVAVHSGHVVSPALADTTLNPYPEAVIEATDTGEGTEAFLLGTNADLTLPGSPTRVFNVKGNFFWQGTVELVISPLTTELYDKVAVTKKVTIESPAKLKVFWPVATHDTHMASRDRNAAWNVVTSGLLTDGIVGETNLELIRPAGTVVTMAVEVNPAKTILKVVKTSGPA